MARLPDNKYAWDFWFAEKDGELHLFYLQASKSECNYNPEARHNLASVWSCHINKMGLARYYQHSLRSGRRHGMDNLSIWTGSIIQDPDDQRFYMFYTSRHREEHQMMDAKANGNTRSTLALPFRMIFTSGSVWITPKQSRLFQIPVVIFLMAWHGATRM